MDRFETPLNDDKAKIAKVDGGVEDPIPDRTASPPDELPVTTEVSPRYRLRLLLVGNLLPSLFLFVFLRAGELVPRWQTGELRAYIAVLVTGTGGLVFYPFILFAIACFSLSVFFPHLASRFFSVRLGVASGILLAFQYCFLQFAMILAPGQFGPWSPAMILLIAIPLTAVITIGVPYAAYLMLRILRSWVHVSRPTRRWTLVIGAVPVAGAILGCLVSNESATSVLALAVVLPGVIVAFSVPYWMLAVYAYQTWKVFRESGVRGQFRLYQVLAAISWLAAYFAAWRFSVTEALAAYSQLPVEPPGNCYVAAAATHGHRRFVRSYEVQCRDGTTRHFTRQLAILKCGEIVLHCTFPRAHRLLRRGYDRYGPTLAAGIVNPWLADVAYLLLKPWEWFVRCALGCLIPDALDLAHDSFARKGTSSIQPASNGYRSDSIGNGS